MSSALLVLLAATTLLVAVLIGRGAGPGSRGLGCAVGLVLEVVGITALLLAGNLRLGLALVLALRSFSPFFASIHVIAVSLLPGARCSSAGGDSRSR